MAQDLRKINLNIHQTLTLLCLIAPPNEFIPFLARLQILSQIWTHLPFPHKYFFVTNCSANVYKTLIKDWINILEPLISSDLLNEKSPSNNFYDKVPNIVFTHDFITLEIAKFNIASYFSTKCDPLLSHLTNLESVYDVMYRSFITWIQSPTANMSPEFYNNVKIPLYDQCHLGYSLPKDCP